MGSCTAQASVAVVRRWNRKALPNSDAIDFDSIPEVTPEYPQSKGKDVACNASGPSEVLERDQLRQAGQTASKASRQQEAQTSSNATRRWSKPDIIQEYASRAELGMNQAVASASDGLFPRAKLGSCWQLLLESDLARDAMSVLGGGAHHYRGVLCVPDEMNLFEALRAELGLGDKLWRRGMSREWHISGGARRMGRFEDLDIVSLPVHRWVLSQLRDIFNAEILAWWTNLYQDGGDAKPFHHDKFARGVKNITIGASFGATRNLTFRHAKTKREFHFPQENGDIFAFAEDVNRSFLHGLHKSTVDAPRISVIIMGRAALKDSEL